MDEKQQFEAWINSERPKLFLNFMSTARPPQYADPKTENLWQAWQASRAAIVVKLPEPAQWDICEVLLDKGKTVQSIRAAGITVKGD